jgi:phage terminase small subunit
VADRTNPSPRERRFIEEYLVDHNASAAIVRAGFQGTRPDLAASKLLAKPRVHRLLEKRLDDKLRGAGYRLDSVIETTLEIRDRCMTAVPVKDRSGKVVKGEFQFDANGALRANELISDLLGARRKKVELSSPGGGPLPTAPATIINFGFEMPDGGPGFAARPEAPEPVPTPDP